MDLHGFMKKIEKHTGRLAHFLTMLTMLMNVYPGCLSAEEAKGDVPVLPVLRLETLTERALQNNPEIIEAKADWAAAQKGIWIESSLPDPVAGYDIMGSMTETLIGPQKNRYLISQEVPFPLKLWEKGKMASREAKAAWHRYRAQVRDIQNKLAKAYYELYFVDASLETLDETKALLKKIEGVAESRYANRSGSQRDVAKTEAEVSMSLEKFYRLRQERESVSAMIHTLLNEDPMLPLGKAATPEKPVLKHTLVELVNLAVANRDEIKEMEALAAKSRHVQRLAKLSNIPDINVGFEYVRVGPNSMSATDVDGRDSWMFPVRFNIPIWQNRIIPEIQQAGKLREAADARLIAAKNMTFYEIKDAYWRYDSAIKIAQLYETAVIPQAELALNADQAGYESGKTDFLNLLDSERVYLNAKLSQIQFFSEALQAYADLVRATGLDFEDTAITGTGDTNEKK